MSRIWSEIEIIILPRPRHPSKSIGVHRIPVRCCFDSSRGAAEDSRMGIRAFTCWTSSFSQADREVRLSCFDRSVHMVESVSFVESDCIWRPMFVLDSHKVIPLKLHPPALSITILWFFIFSRKFVGLIFFTYRATKISAIHIGHFLETRQPRSTRSSVREILLTPKFWLTYLRIIERAVYIVSSYFQLLGRMSLPKWHRNRLVGISVVLCSYLCVRRTFSPDLWSKYSSKLFGARPQLSPAFESNFCKRWRFQIELVCFGRRCGFWFGTGQEIARDSIISEFSSLSRKVQRAPWTVSQREFRFEEVMGWSDSVRLGL